MNVKRCTVSRNRTWIKKVQFYRCVFVFLCISLALFLLIPLPGIEKEHKTCRFHCATCFHVAAACVCKVLMTQSLQMFSSVRIFCSVCDHLQYGRRVTFSGLAARVQRYCEWTRTNTEHSISPGVFLTIFWCSFFSLFFFQPWRFECPVPAAWIFMFCFQTNHFAFGAIKSNTRRLCMPTFTNTTLTWLSLFSLKKTFEWKFDVFLWRNVSLSCSRIRQLMTPATSHSNDRKSSRANSRPHQTEIKMVCETS